MLELRRRRRRAGRRLVHGQPGHGDVEMGHVRRVGGRGRGGRLGGVGLDRFDLRMRRLDQPLGIDRARLPAIAEMGVESLRRGVVRTHHQLGLRAVALDQEALRRLGQRPAVALAAMLGVDREIVEPPAMAVETDHDRADDRLRLDVVVRRRLRHRQEQRRPIGMVHALDVGDRVVPGAGQLAGLPQRDERGMIGIAVGADTHGETVLRVRGKRAGRAGFRRVRARALAAVRSRPACRGGCPIRPRSRHRPRRPCRPGDRARRRARRP